MDERRQYPADMQQLRVIVERLSVMAETNEKHRLSDMEMIKRAVSGIEALNERMQITIGMSKDIDTIKDRQSENKEDIRVIKHDLGALANGLQAIPILGEKITENAKVIAELNVKVNSLETWRDKFEGAAAAYKRMIVVLWTIGGTLLTSGAVFLVDLYVKAKTGSGIISGE